MKTENDKPMMPMMPMMMTWMMTMELTLMAHGQCQCKSVKATKGCVAAACWFGGCGWQRTTADDTFAGTSAPKLEGVNDYKDKDATEWEFEFVPP
ncbi:GH13132 [Drosophila grimshawi]|uniref:GH13132 n=1 Tax=Drosophila grimshawi TaxID=7222 RepID=B4JQR5_DROGR|nr:GH13132 [Drosophila grimshawi]